MVYKNGNSEDMYIAVANIAFNISLLYRYIGDYDDTRDLEWIVLDAIEDELWHLHLRVSNERVYVDTGHTKQSPCAYINVNFSVIFKYAFEYESQSFTEQTIEFLHNLTNTKFYTLDENSTLERISQDYDCSICKSENSSSFCTFVPKVSTVDEALVKRKSHYTCPYIFLREDEHDNLTRQNIISSSAKLIRRSDGYIVCIKDIKFNFDALGEMGATHVVEKYLTYSCFGISTLSLFGFLVAFCITPSMQTLPVKTISNLVVSLFLAQVVYMSTIGANDDALFCYIAGVVLHYLWVCTYAWSVICAHHMCKVFRSIRKSQIVTTKRYIIYLCIGYITPLLFVAVFVVGEKCNCFSFEVSYGGTICFLNSGKFYGLDVPIICMLLANLTYFGVIAYGIYMKNTTSKQKVSGAKNSSFLLYIKISTVMGFSWVFGMLAKWTNVYPLWILFTVIHGLQGTFLFIVFACRGDFVAFIKQRGQGTDKLSRHTTVSRQTTTSR